jgi:hypothetical protein
MQTKISPSSFKLIAQNAFFWQSGGGGEFKWSFTFYSPRTLVLYLFHFYIRTSTGERKVAATAAAATTTER